MSKVGTCSQLCSFGWQVIWDSFDKGSGVLGEDLGAKELEMGGGRGKAEVNLIVKKSDFQADD